MLQAGPLWALGTMSGTSLDGVDAAMIRTDGHEIFDFGARAYLERGSEARALLAEAMGRWPGEDGVAAAAQLIEEEHYRLIKDFEDADIVGFHGQTLAHDPQGRGTHQAGDGRVLAEALGLPVVWDFRSADVAMGGQGAPLAPFYHFACARWIGALGPLVFLNLGGVGNVTWVDPTKAGPEVPGALLAFDTGPANAPINDLMEARLGVPFDDGGSLAAGGKVDASFVADVMAHPFFSALAPKSLDRNTFQDVLSGVSALSDADAAASLVAVVAESVAAGIALCPEVPSAVLVTGGGRKNKTIISALRSKLNLDVKLVEEVGLDGDMLEAQAFGYLAVRALRGLTTAAPGTTGGPAATGGGVVSWPERSVS